MKETTLTPPTPQQECLTKIGTDLQQLRLESDLTLATLARRTNIRAMLLHNIEMGQLEQLPEPVYLQGLIRRYADSLGADGQAIAQTFPVEAVQDSWKLSRWRNFFFQFQLRPSHLYFVYILVIVTTIQSLANVIRLPNTALDPELQSTEEVLPEAPSTVSSSPEPTESNKNTALVKDLSNQLEENLEEDSVVIDIKAEDTAWMRVEIDGKTEFEGMLPKGKTQQWVVDESVKIRAGNAGAVIITINDEKPHPLGEPGAVEEFTYQALAEDGTKMQRSPS
ncbi:MAG: RodZ domain-containing protein [Limnothrix sp.]